MVDRTQTRSAIVRRWQSLLGWAEETIEPEEQVENLLAALDDLCGLR